MISLNETEEGNCHYSAEHSILLVIDALSRRGGLAVQLLWRRSQIQLYYVYLRLANSLSPPQFCHF